MLHNIIMTPTKVCVFVFLPQPIKVVSYEQTPTLLVYDFVFYLANTCLKV